MEDQINDLTELHQHEVYNIKQVLQPPLSLRYHNILHQQITFFLD